MLGNHTHQFQLMLVAHSMHAYSLPLNCTPSLRFYPYANPSLVLICALSIHVHQITLPLAPPSSPASGLIARGMQHSSVGVTGGQKVTKKNKVASLEIEEILI